MSREYWLQQSKEKPLFEDLLWSRPENKLHAGKLLIIGGNAHGFAAPAEAYQESLSAGVGTSRVLLPDALQKMVSKIFPAAEYGSSTPSGSFGVKALAEFIDLSMWSDGVLLSDNFGKNSETAILFEKFIDKYKGPLALVGDSLDYFLAKPEALLDREETLLITSLSQLQKMSASSRFTSAFTSDMGVLKLVDTLHEFTTKHQATIVLQLDGAIAVGSRGRVVTTQKAQTSDLKIASHSVTWLIQNNKKSLEAIASALYAMNQKEII